MEEMDCPFHGEDADCNCRRDFYDRYSDQGCPRENYSEQHYQNYQTPESIKESDERTEWEDDIPF